MPQKINLFRIPMRGPGDVSGLASLLDSGEIAAADIVAILGKTEGNGGVNDFTREYASMSLANLLASRMQCNVEAVEKRVALVMSGGTEGVLSPHMSVFARSRVDGKIGGGKRLAIGVAQTREFLPEELGRQAQIDETAKAVREAILDAEIGVEDVHFVQIKCPLLTSKRVESARARGHEPVTDEAYASMAYSRGASALGVAVALGETRADVGEAELLRDWSVYSGVASTSAGIELTRSVIVVMGNSASAAGELIIGHAVMRDAIDLAGVLDAFASVGLNGDRGLDAVSAGRVVNVFAKAEPSTDGSIRGFRHTMLDDSDITPTRHARAAVGGVIAGVTGSGAIYVSGGAEHQGPMGGGPIAVVARAEV
ncbi:MAG: atzD [Rhodocyclales bacterium]|nr:atzD [Rhodocyclales bacterium]